MNPRPKFETLPLSQAEHRPNPTYSGRIRRGLAIGTSLVALLGLSSGLAFGQPSYAIPEAPALTFLDTNPGKISRPTTPRALGTQILSAIDSAGRVQQGMALDLAPWSLIPGLAIPLTKYQESIGAFVLANTQVSLATVRSAADSSATDLAFGVRMTLWDGTDPMRDRSYVQSLRDKQRECADEHLAQPGGAAQFENCIDDFLPQRRKEWLAENWNQPALSVALAGGWRLSGSRLDQRSWMGYSTWMTGALPLSVHGQLVAELRYDHRELAEEERNALNYGSRVLFGSSRFNLFAELSGRSLLGTDDREDDFTGQWAAGVEFQAAEGFWLTAGLGEDISLPENARSQIAVIANVRLQLTEAPRIGQLIKSVREPPQGGL